jgi:signal transduction histidine kinase
MVTYFRYNFYVLSIILLSTLNLFSQETISLNNLKELEEIGKQTYYLEDASLQLTIDDVISDSLQSKFKANSQKAINFSSTASAYWLKFNVTNTTSEDFYLNVGSAYIDAISLYEFDETNTLISTRQTGDDLPFYTREIEVGNYLFALDLEKGNNRTYYLRVKSDQPLFFLLRVGTLKSFIAYEHDLDFLQGIYFGVMLLIFLYNLFLYFSTREKIYLYYIAYVFSITWFMASVFGYFFEYFWPNTPSINKLVVISSGLTMITATLFTQKFLNTKEADPKMHKGSMVFLVLGVLVCILVPLGFKIESLKIAQGGLLIMAIYFLVLGIRFRLKGYRPANYYLLAWGALILGIFFAILESLNITRVMSYLNAMQIGSALEVVLLSFALGDRINMYKKEKEDAQLEALNAARENERLIQEQNVLLEKKVKERTAEVAIQNEKLIELNKEKDMLINMAAHDLRTPLTHIRLLVQLIDVTSLELTSNQKSYLEEIDNSASRLTQMIGRILNLHALETNQVKLKKEVVDLVELVNYVIKCFRLSSEEKEIKVTTNIEPGNHLIEVDKSYMIQVLENLLSNAIKFSERGTQVKFYVKTVDDKTHVIIEDQGPGISEEDQKKLFGRFQKLSAQPTAGETSIGLGLSIVKKYIESMEGEIVCVSKLGVGTKFIMSFDSVEHHQLQ